jgi:hypothetical protein
MLAIAVAAMFAVARQVRWMSHGGVPAAEAGGWVALVLLELFVIIGVLGILTSG